ncbi:hypothetical protein [Spiroplasma clarkii]|nr:hypothetical protein [Spiroplasma clarkii]
MFDWEVFDEYVGSIAAQQQAELMRFLQLLQAENQKYNLTTIVETEDIFYKHF